MCVEENLHFEQLKDGVSSSLDFKQTTKFPLTKEVVARVDEWISLIVRISFSGYMAKLS